VAGFCGIAWNDAGITRVQLPARSAETAERLLLRRAPDTEAGMPTPMVREAVAAMKRYFEGTETDFSHLKLDLSGQNEFFKRVYAAARRVNWGKTTTYSTLAEELGGRARRWSSHGQNPIPLIIPCHRILAAGG
jgi:methylated-DNA-[protein]-cysteine S-methyltransferase